MKAIAWLRVCLLTCVSLAFCVVAMGQTNGEIRGSVTDPSGAVVPGASVTATQVGTDTNRMVTAGSDGSFDIPGTSRRYVLGHSRSQGLQKIHCDGRRRYHWARCGRKCDPASRRFERHRHRRSKRCSSRDDQHATRRGDDGYVDPRASLNTRNAYALLQLQPGVQSQLGADLFAGSDNPGVVSVNGGRGRSNNYMVNGGDGNDIFVNSPAIQPSPDAIEEFRVLTNTFDAEYGRNSGSVVNVVTKSGTNAVHGDFYEFIRNDALNTKGFFDNSVAPYKQNQFGATIGGPIKKNRTFIFGLLR